MNLANLRIGTKLAFAFTLITLLTVILGALSWIQLSRVEAGVDDIAGNWLPSVQAIGNVRIAANRLRRTQSELLMPEKSNIERGKADLADRHADLEKAEAVYAPLVVEGEERQRFEAYKVNRAAYLAGEPRLVAMLADPAVPHDDLVRQYVEDYNKLYTAMTKSLADLTEFNRQSADAAHNSALAVYSQAQITIAGLMIVIVIVSFLLAWWITRLITVPLAQAVIMASKVAHGDLTMQVSVVGKDESAQLMRALSEMRDSLSRVVGEVRSNAEGVATASAQIEQGNHDLSGRTEQQAAALEETAASMEELSSTVRQTSDNAQQASKLATEASTVATRGGQVVGEVVATMKGIDEASRRIADIIGVIDSIAFQTNILALNAAVEAARAGEQGRGFAVVASEVRNLAGRSADAAKEIKALIDTSVERVGQGSALVARAGDTMGDVVQAIQRVADIVAEISVASREQSAGVSQVGETVTKMDQATQQNAALVEESAAAASSLKSQAQQLVQAVSVFQLTSAELTQTALRGHGAQQRITA